MYDRQRLLEKRGQQGGNAGGGATSLMLTRVWSPGGPRGRAMGGEAVSMDGELLQEMLEAYIEEVCAGLQQSGESEGSVSRGRDGGLW